jgi:hypothetical protein
MGMNPDGSPIFSGQNNHKIYSANYPQISLAIALIEPYYFDLKNSSNTTMPVRFIVLSVPEAWSVENNHEGKQAVRQFFILRETAEKACEILNAEYYSSWTTFPIVHA